MPIVGVVALIITAAVTEEILYRGYSIEQLTSLTGRRWIGVAVSLAIFILPHVIFFAPDWLITKLRGLSRCTRCMCGGETFTPACSRISW